jgi:hypothetical protein
MTARKLHTLYGQDYQLWLETTVEQLRQAKFSSVDWDNLIEELDSMGKSDNDSSQDARDIMSRLMGCRIDIFPTTAIATLEQVLDNDWFPDENDGSIATLT